ncbi:prephenate dehydratase [Candidatus Bathyarchaeota archaeon]|nr:prephenate dehydratase [Candidatus Bathyarchaeota archaeon]
MRIAFQGERGAYSEEAIINHFGWEAEPIPKPSLKDAFRSVEMGEAEYGLVPAENTLEGSVTQTYDLLLESELKIRGEAILRIVHCLMANPGVTLKDIRRVYSHPQALRQCSHFIERNRLEEVPMYDTAGSAKMIKEANLRDAAAIASRRAAEIYGLNILSEHIESNPENYTRFLIIGPEDYPLTRRDKTTIAFKIEHAPGTLFRALKAFAKRGLNLTKIESRPIPGRPWEYTFYLDLEGHREDQLVKLALKELEKASLYIKILGSYPRA